MKLKDWIWVGQMDRQNGKTSVLVAAARLINATLVCLSSREANRVSRENDIPTISVSEPADRLRGRHGPLLFDTSAVVQICAEGQMEVDAAERRATDAEFRARNLATELGNAKSQLESAEAKIKVLERQLKEAQAEAEKLQQKLDDAQDDAGMWEDRVREIEEENEEAVEVDELRIEALARLVANPHDADAIRAAKDVLPAEKGGYL